MNKERELLVEAVEWMQELKYVYADARDSGDRVLLELIADINKIENLLTQPEQEPSDTEIITAYQMLVRRKLGLQEKNEVLQLGEPEFNAQITVKKDCKHKNNGRCYLHNLQCQYPECEE